MDNNKIRKVTKKESLILIRNEIFIRLTGFEMELLYWEGEYKRAKWNSQEKVDAKGNVADRKKKIKGDKIYLKDIENASEVFVEE